MSDATPETLEAVQAQTVALVQRIQGGDRKAGAALVQRASGRLLAMIMLRMGPAMRRRHDPEDVLQEVWLEIFKSLRTFDPARGVPFGGWAATIIRRALDRLNARDQGRPEPEAAFRDPNDSEPAIVEEAAPISSPSLQAYRRESVEHLVDAVEALPAEQREAMASYWFDELPAGAIAERMGKTRQAVYMLVSRANKTLAAALRSEADSLPASWLMGPRA
ncbi:MAG: sigma-70 family RNA polymerase sigma factor [Planctomycetota bacterium]|nr:MAG: sigma-70 family RNA polymerase sigma factor [Planctomycetota bacterium]